MKVETFLDYGQILKVIFEITDEQVDYDFICDTEDKRLSNIIIDNLKSISSVEATENLDIYRLSINNTIFIDVSKTTGKIKSINKLTAFETRLLAQGKTKSVPFSREQKNAFLPRTDLHTHFAGAMTPQTLIDIGKKHDIDYLARFLTKMGINISKYNIDEKTFMREVESVLKIQDAYPKMIIARTRHDKHQYEGIEIVDIAEWLANYIHLSFNIG